ncbi:uncharacterized protein CXQ87_001751 [Candidozyma duobushaemuli]|uniref:Palmitoyltransferase n=2 Tax=Candidozyma TaxID=3303203 RepID=A0ABX8I4C0_9ASCO|nr:uncharacterized protein CXQ87_001751 [[Candida] duobushaemulonis]PVH13640.1 hypothetical protein CXQ87_001751 [[Candida] duobushaemulonis]QWU88125.1 hypothetical protein CA3LBN_002390 [[Candida] haemuloni]
MFLLGTLIIVFGTLVAVLLFGDQPRFRGTWLHRLYKAVNRANGNAAHWVVGFTTGNPIVGSVLRWSIPLFYVGIICFCVNLFFANVYGQLPVSIKNSISYNFWIAVSIAALGASTALVTFVDPGRVTASNVHQATTIFRPNGLIFFDKQCFTCNLPKPARSKHCSTCHKCVLLYDHHCLWVNNCIGLRNYRWFCAYLISNVNLMAYGGALCFWMLQAQKQQYSQLGWWKLITSTTDQNRIAGILAILTAIFVPITSVFTVLHIRYLYLGVTTSEADKWGEIEHLVRLGVLFYIVELEQFAEQATMIDRKGDYTKAYLALDDESILLTAEEEPKYTLRKISSVEHDLVNVYDRGFWNNVQDRLFRIPWTT